MDTNGFSPNQPDNQQFYRPPHQPINQQPFQYPLPVNKTKNTNTMLIVVAGLATVLSSIFASIISNVISKLLLNNSYSDSITFSYLISSLSQTVSFFITAVIIIIACVIVCKKSADRLKFFACCLSGKAIGGFFQTVITAIILVVLNIADIDTAISKFSIIISITNILGIIVSAVAAALLLYFMLSKEKTVAPINNNMSTQKYNTVNF